MFFKKLLRMHEQIRQPDDQEPQLITEGSTTLDKDDDEEEDPEGGEEDKKVAE